jgi:hypothetical protein
LLGEAGHLRPQVVAHEIEFVPAVALSGMTGKLGGRRSKDQPSTTGIDSGKAKHIFEKGPVGIGVACVDDGMHACNHSPSPSFEVMSVLGSEFRLCGTRNNAPG